jgi:prephenate dehydratase
MINAVASAKRVAFQGEPGAYANLAAREAVPHAAAIPKPTFEDAIEAAKSGDCTSWVNISCPSATNCWG